MEKLKKLEKFSKDFDDLADHDKNRLILKMPVKLLVKFYSDFCNKEQIKQLFDSWIDFVDKPREVGDSDAARVSDNAKKKIKLMIKRLQKKNKADFIPDYVLENYSD